MGDEDFAPISLTPSVSLGGSAVGGSPPPPPAAGLAFDGDALAFDGDDLDFT